MVATTMTDSASLYRLLSWLSPGYPVGAFSYSHGLEYEVETGAVRDGDDLVEWIGTVLLFGTGRIDGVLFREIHGAVMRGDGAHVDARGFRAIVLHPTVMGPKLLRAAPAIAATSSRSRKSCRSSSAGRSAADGVDEMAELGDAFQPSAEIARESRAQGAAFLDATSAAWPAPGVDRLTGGAVYPVAVALACAAHGIGLDDGLEAYYHAFAANLVSAGVRLIPLGQTDGQRALAALEPVVTAARQQAETISVEDMGSAAPMLDIGSMLHETQYTRLFRS